MTDIQKSVKYNEEYAKEYMAHHRDRESRISGNSVQFRIYLFDDNLRDSAKKLLHQFRDITICSCTYKDYNDCKSIAATRDHYLSCCKPRKGVRFTPGNFDIQCRSFHDLMSDKYIDDASVCDVAIIMGHSSALFAEDYNVISGLAQMNPTVVAFVGCGEGNARFGPVANISHMLSCVCEVTPIVGFYQRRIYLSELQNTSLIIGLRYYAGLIKHFQVTADQPQIRKQIARCTFGLATAQLAPSSTDPSVFVNDSPAATSFIQNSYKSLQDIPLSCMQLAMCNPLVAGSEDIADNKDNSNFDEWCKKEIKSRELHKLVPLMCEIDLIRLAGETLKNLRSGKWEEIDHLQFLTAVLRGHWGMNSLGVVKEWATFHLMEVMNVVKLQDKFSLHQYKLCCMCFVLLCDDHFVRFDEKYGIIACTSHPCPPVLDRLYDVTAGGYISTSLCIHKLNKLPLPFPDEPELPWVQLYRQCRFIPDFVNLYKDNRSYLISNHDPFNTSHGQVNTSRGRDYHGCGHRGRGYHGRGHRGRGYHGRGPVNAGRGTINTGRGIVNTSRGRGHCGSGPVNAGRGTVNTRRGCGPVNTSCGPANMKYEYTRDEFLLAMGALSDYVKKTEDTLLRESQIVITELENDANPQSERARERCIAELSPQQKTDIKDKLSILLQRRELRLLNRKVVLEHPQILAHLRKHVIRPTVFDIGLFFNADGLMKYRYFDEDLLQNTTETSTQIASPVTDEHRAEIHSTAVSNEVTIDELHQQNVAERITFYKMKVLLDHGYAGIKDIKDEELIECYQDEPATPIDKNQFDITKQNAEASDSWKCVNFCRFVFAKFNNPTVNNEITGILFFTDNHYGHTLINLDQRHRDQLCDRDGCRHSQIKYLKHIIKTW